jgi:dihydrofolate reductase
MRVSLIVAVAENGVIGLGNDLPWRQSNDLKRLKRLTMGHHVIMGRRTWDSVGTPLPGRTNVVITRNPHFSAPGVTVVRSVEDALALDNDDEMFIAGGAEIFRIALPLIDRAYLTIIHARPDGDTFFPEVDWSGWRVVEKSEHPADEKNQYPYTFITYERERREGGQ